MMQASEEENEAIASKVNIRKIQRRQWDVFFILIVDRSKKRTRLDTPTMLVRQMLWIIHRSPQMIRTWWHSPISLLDPTRDQVRSGYFQVTAAYFRRLHRSWQIGRNLLLLSVQRNSSCDSLRSASFHRHWAECQNRIFHIFPAQKSCDEKWKCQNVRSLNLCDFSWSATIDEKREKSSMM